MTSPILDNPKIGEEAFGLIWENTNFGELWRYQLWKYTANKRWNGSASFGIQCFHC